MWYCCNFPYTDETTTVNWALLNGSQRFLFKLLIHQIHLKIKMQAISITSLNKMLRFQVPSCAVFPSKIMVHKTMAKTNEKTNGPTNHEIIQAQMLHVGNMYLHFPLFMWPIFHLR